MKLIPFLLSFLLAFVGMAQSPLPSTKTFSVITGTNGILTGASTNFFVLNTNLLFKAIQTPINGASNALVAALVATNTARIGDINTSSNYLSGLVSSVSTSVSSSISSAISSATSTITTAYNAAIAAAGAGWNSLIATRSVDSVSALLALRTDSLPGTTNITVFVRGYYDRSSGGGGTFHLAPLASLPVDVTGTNRGTCFVTTDNATMAWVRRDRGALSVVDFGTKSDGSTDDQVIVQDAVNSAQEIIFPFGITTRVGTGSGSAITVPANRVLHIRGSISGPAYWKFSGTTLVDGGGTVLLGYDIEPRKMQFFGGNVVVRDCRFVGVGAGWALNVHKDAAIASFTADRCWFENCQAGVLREAYVTNAVNTNLYCLRGRVMNCTFTNMTQNGADWEPCLGDKSVEYLDNTLSKIAWLYTGSNGFGGFALAVAGWNYDPNGNEALQLRRITVSGNNINGARLGIHVEYCSDASIQNNRFADIDESYGTTTGGGVYFPDPVTAAIEVYGCKRWNVTGNVGGSVRSTTTGRYAIFSSGHYADSDRYVIANNVFDEGDIYGELMPKFNGATWPDGVNMPIATLQNNVLHNGGLYLVGRGNWNLIGNTLRGRWGQNALTMDLQSYFSSGLQGNIRNLLVLKNNTAINPMGGASYSFSTFNDPDNQSNFVVEASGNNFPVTSTSQAAKSAGTVYYSYGGVPYGRTFQAGDVVLDTSQRPPRPILITAAGSRSAPSDYCNATGTNAARGYVGAATLAWGSGGYHQAGQMVQVTGVPGTVTGMIDSIFIDSYSGYTVARLVDPTTGIPLNLTGFTPALMKAANEVGFTTQGFYMGAWDPPSLAPGVTTQLTGLGVIGALPGDLVAVSFSKDTQGLILTGCVTTNDLCRIILFNGTTNTVDLASGTLKVSTTTAQ